MLTLEQLNRLRGISTTNSRPTEQVAPKVENKQPSVNNNLGVDESILNKLNPKWRNLLEATKDVDMSKYINENTKYDDFGMPIIDFNAKNKDELPKISQFGISE